MINIFFWVWQFACSVNFGENMFIYACPFGVVGFAIIFGFGYLTTLTFSLTSLSKPQLSLFPFKYPSVLTLFLSASYDDAQSGFRKLGRKLCFFFSHLYFIGVFALGKLTRYFIGNIQIISR